MTFVIIAPKHGQKRRMPAVTARTRCGYACMIVGISTDAFCLGAVSVRVWGAMAGGGCEVRFGSIPTRQKTDPNLRRRLHCVWGTCYDQEASCAPPLHYGRCAVLMTSLRRICCDHGAKCFL